MESTLVSGVLSVILGISCRYGPHSPWLSWWSSSVRTCWCRASRKWSSRLTCTHPAVVGVLLFISGAASLILALLALALFNLRPSLSFSAFDVNDCPPFKSGHAVWQPGFQPRPLLLSPGDFRRPPAVGINRDAQPIGWHVVIRRRPRPRILLGSLQLLFRRRVRHPVLRLPDTDRTLDALDFEDEVSAQLA